MSDFSEKRVQQQIRNFERAMDGYEGNEPFARYLTSFLKLISKWDQRTENGLPGCVIIIFDWVRGQRSFLNKKD